MKNDNQESPGICLTFENKPLEDLSKSELRRLLDEMKLIFNPSTEESRSPETASRSDLPP